MTEERDTRLDEALSALRDGELSSSEQVDVRRRIDSDPALRERMDAFEAVDRALGGLASREVPPDLAQRLRERIDRDRVVPRVRVRGPGQRTALPRRRGGSWGAVGVGLAAAALVLYLAIPMPPQQQTGPGLGPTTPVEVPPVEVVATAPSPVAPVEEVPAELDGFQDASEEEVAIAFHYETLADLEMIEELEMLELLAALDEGRPRG